MRLAYRDLTHRRPAARRKVPPHSLQRGSANVPRLPVNVTPPPGVNDQLRQPRVLLPKPAPRIRLRRGREHAQKLDEPATTRLRAPRVVVVQLAQRVAKVKAAVVRIRVLKVNEKVPATLH
ncbi:Choline kinase/Ethanolamine kinase [Trypanosoma cruzi]|nr:Choline kinase/Ethanolamine kinase [Trypanosoma cruzi]